MSLSLLFSDLQIHVTYTRFLKGFSISFVKKFSKALSCEYMNMVFQMKLSTIKPRFTFSKFFVKLYVKFIKKHCHVL